MRAEALKPSGANWVIGRFEIQTEIEINGIILYLPDEYLHGKMINPITDTPLLRILEVADNMDEEVEVGALYACHFLDKVSLQLINDTSAVKVPLEKLLSKVEKHDI